MRGPYDVVVVGGGPAGACAALGVLAERPGASVLVLDRAEFPRDKVCGDGVAPQLLDVLSTVGVSGLLDDWPTAGVLRLDLPGGPAAEQVLDRPGWVVPRTVLDARLLDAARARGAQVHHLRVRGVRAERSGVVVDGGSTTISARVLIGADGAHSVVRRALAPAVPAQRAGTTAVALRGYAPVLPEHAGAQVLVFSAAGRRPSYAWSFAIGDGRANVGYGELLPPPGSGAARPTRAHLLDRLEELLPGAGAHADHLAGHPLPLSTGRARQWGRGRVLLAGDAASLVNPITGEGIYYAALSGVAAGRAAAVALARDGGPSAAGRYGAAVRRALAVHLRSTDVAERLVRSDAVLAAALRACAGDPEVFAAVSEMGLARGRLTWPVVAGLGRQLVAGALHRSR